MWRAEFTDGPVREDGPFQIHFSVRPVLHVLYMVKLAGRWVRVGDEYLVPDEPWPGQVKYIADQDNARIDDETADLVIPYMVTQA